MRTTPAREGPARSTALKSGLSWLFLLLLVVVLWRFVAEAPRPTAAPPAEPPAVRLVAPALIAVQPGSPLEHKLETTTIRKERIQTPLLTVTGAVMARLRTGPGTSEDRWQFSSVELSGIFADWERAATEVEFSSKELAKTRELVAAQEAAQARVVERLRKLVATGTEAVRDLSAAEAQLLQTQLEGQKSVFQVESALTQALHSQADLTRRLLQAGVDPALLKKVAPGAALVMADVPEVRLGLVAVGQACEARFYGLPGQTFKGVVRSLAPALSPERRTLRVFFELDDREGRLKPGMYAEIGLGTDPRTAVLAPADGVLHIAGADYVLVAAGPSEWRIAEVQVGERSGESVEILGGLGGGETLIGNGAILLKPLLVQALLQSSKPPKDPRP